MNAPATGLRTAMYEQFSRIGKALAHPRRLELGKPLPKAGVFAHGEAEVVAANIAHAITGAGATERFDGKVSASSKSAMATSDSAAATSMRSRFRRSRYARQAGIGI